MGRGRGKETDASILTIQIECMVLQRRGGGLSERDGESERVCMGERERERESERERERERVRGCLRKIGTFGKF